MYRKKNGALFALVAMLLACLVFGCAQNDSDDEEAEPQNSASTYTLAFDANGGTGTMAPLTCTCGETVQLPTQTFTAPSDDYYFAGWAQQSGSNQVAYTDGESVKNLTAENGTTVTLYAVWLLKGEHSIIYKNVENADNSASPASFLESEAITLATPTRTGYTFDGWFTTEDYSGTAITGWAAGGMPDDVTLYAKWTINTYTVTFDSDGGTSVAAQTVEHGKTATAPAAPSKTDCTFVGWYNGSAIYDFATPVTADLTLTAQWRAADVPAWSATRAASGMYYSSDEIVYIPPATTALVENAGELTGIGNGNVYYMATTGSDENDGSFTAPFATLRKAIETMSSGDTLYIRGGTYTVTADQVMISDKSVNTQCVNATTSSNENAYTCIYEFAKGGSKNNPISFVGYPGERPVFDFSAINETVVTPSANATYRRIAALHVIKSYYYFRNFEIIGVQQNNITKNQCECIRVNGGNNNTFENLAMHDGMGIGWYLAGGTHNLVLNCDAYNNADRKSATDGDGIGGDTDGFGCHPRGTAHVGNMLVGCRSWLNADDGFDLINAIAQVKLESCWAMQNGYATAVGDDSRKDSNLSAGNGLKSGGYAYQNFGDGADKVPQHVVSNSIASKNKAHGVYANHHIGGNATSNATYANGAYSAYGSAYGGLEFEYNSAYGNYYNYSMETRYLVSSTNIDSNKKITDLTSSDISQNALNYTLKYNIGFNGKVELQKLDVTSSDNTLVGNSFDNGATAPTASDFESTDWTELYLPRDENGNLPQINFLKLNASSSYYNADKAQKAGFDYDRYLEQVEAARSAAGYQS